MKVFQSLIDKMFLILQLQNIQFKERVKESRAELVWQLLLQAELTSPLATQGKSGKGRQIQTQEKSVHRREKRERPEVMIGKGHEEPINSRAAECQHSSNVQETVVKLIDRVLFILLCPIDPQHVISNVSLQSLSTYDVGYTAHVKKKKTKTRN